MSFEVKTIIDENAHYQLAVVKLPDVPVDVYGVINKQYNVCEMSVSVLPQARESFGQFNKWMLEIENPALPNLEDASPTGALS